MLPALDNVSTSCPAGINDSRDDPILIEEKVQAFQKDRQKKDNHNRSKDILYLSYVSCRFSLYDSLNILFDKGILKPFFLLHALKIKFICSTHIILEKLLLKLSCLFAIKTKENNGKQQAAKFYSVYATGNSFVYIIPESW